MRQLALVRRHRRRQLGGSSRVTWPPTVGRCAGGMLGVLVAETWPIGSTQALGPGGPIANAMVDLARSLTWASTRDAVGEVADRHDGIAGPAWLLPLALTQSESTELAADAVELASRAHVPTDEVHACVAYVELAAQMVAEQPVPAAIAKVAGIAVPDDQPLETGRQTADGLTLGLWALTQQAPFGELLGKLAATSSPPVVAAAAGMVGLRDSFNAIPAAWYRRLDLADACLALAQPLQQTLRPHACADTAS
jgi:hypothetical protein